MTGRDTGNDNPYRDDSVASVPAPRDRSASRPGSRTASGGRAAGRGNGTSRAAATPAEPPAAAKPAAAKPANGGRGGRPPAARSQPAKPAESRPESRTEGRSRRRRRGGGAYAAQPQLTSVSTSRTAYTETRIWLLEQHGPVCAYCGVRFTADVMTLDHVAPRRGLTAYDRRDNLVLACRGCNAAKADKAPIAFLLGGRMRAANMLRYGQHLSPMLVELARSLAKPESPSAREEIRREFERWAALDDTGDSPYRG